MSEEKFKSCLTDTTVGPCLIFEKNTAQCNDTAEARCKYCIAEESKIKDDIDPTCIACDEDYYLGGDNKCHKVATTKATGIALLAIGMLCCLGLLAFVIFIAIKMRSADSIDGQYAPYAGNVSAAGKPADFARKGLVI